jgi:periplasmic divalent cation tolerance protein
MTAANRDEAGRIAEALVEARLAACVQILPAIESVYHWKGEITRDNEVLMLAKSTRERFAELEARVRELHSYETPEIVALAITEGSADYLKWLTSFCEGS